MRDRQNRRPFARITDMQRAAKIFLLDERASDSPFVRRIWRTRSAHHESFISVAMSAWQMCITRQNSRTYLTLRGPETRATVVPIPANAEFLGIEFELGTFMPSLPVRQLVDTRLTLPEATSKSFRLNGAAWDFPDYDNADSFVSRLVREGLLVRDPVVVAALQNQPVGLSVRSIERRVLRATGLTRGAIRQIERAKRAVELLDQGRTILDTVAHAGFTDQPHLTKSLRRFIGQTPARIADDAA